MTRQSCIVLLSHSQEPYCTRRVAEALAVRGARPLRIDTDDFPGSLPLTGEIDPDGGARVRLGAEVLEVDAVWSWRLGSPRPWGGAPGPHREAAARESLTTLRGLLDVLAERAWIDAIDAARCAENKTRQLRLAQGLGLAIPPTLITSDPTAAREFYDAHGGRVVCKLQTALAPSMTGGGGLPTRLLRPQDLDALDGLRGCPMLFQRYVTKARELRIAWVDGRAFVGSLDGARCGVDWRYECDAPWEAHALPDPVHARLAALMARLGLRQGAIDVIVDDAGEYVFLEVNPHGEWGMLERDLGLPIGAALADALLRLSRGPKHRR